MQMEGKPRFTQISEDLFHRTKTQGEILYKQIGAVQCPYFSTTVGFNSSGLEHIKFKDTNQHLRNAFDQYTRFKLLYLVPEILRKSGTVQGVWKTKEWQRQKRHGQWQKVTTDVSYYEFVAVMGKVRIKVVIKKSGLEGKYLFWSIIPFWRMKEAGKKIIHDGNPAED